MALSFGSEYVAESGSTTRVDVVMMDSTHFVIAYVYTYSGTKYLRARVGEISTDGSISFGSSYNIKSISATYSFYFVSLTSLSSTSFAIAYSETSSSQSHVRIGTISGTSIQSVGGEYTYYTSRTTGLLETLDSTHIIIFYQSTSTNHLFLRIGSVSGTSIALGTQYNEGGQSTEVSGNIEGIGVIDSTHFIYVYGWSGYGYGRRVTVNGTNMTFGSLNTLVSSNFAPKNLSHGNGIGMLDSTHAIMGYQYGSGNYDGRATVLTINGDTITAGTSYTFNSGSNLDYLDVATLDDSHFVIVYTDYGNSYYGTALRGTVSGTSITFDSETVFNYDSTYYTAITKEDSSHIIVAYQDYGNSSYATTIRGTSPTSVSVSVSQLSLTTSQVNPTILNSVNISLGFQGLSVGQLGPIISGQVKIDPSVQSLSFIQITPSILYSCQVNVGVESISTNLNSPYIVIISNVLVEAGVLSINTSQKTLTIVTGEGITTQVGVKDVVASILSPTVLGNALVSLSVLGGSVSQLSPVIKIGAVLSLNTQDVTLLQKDPSIFFSCVLSLPAQNLIITENTPVLPMWGFVIKSSSSWTNQSKNTASWTNQNKNTTTWTNLNKS